MVFMIAGLALSAGLFCIGFLANMYSGMGDGASSGPSGRVPLAGIVVPYACYFAIGAAAALASNRSSRAIAAAFAHLVPFLGLIWFRGSDATFLLAVNIGTFLVFGAAWFSILTATKNGCPSKTSPASPHY